MAYGDPSYSYGKLIAREGMMPVYSGSPHEGNLSVSWQDDPNYQKSQQLTDFQKKIASGQIQESGSYGKSQKGEGPDFSTGARQSAYTSYDPSTNMVTFYDPEGNVTQQGQRSSAGGMPGFASGALGVVGGVGNAIGTVASNPQALVAIAAAVAIPGIGAAIGESLMAAGVVGGAEAASAAAIAAGATAAEAAAAGAAATATATAIGTAIASTAVQVAQGVPVDKAITNTLVNVGVSQVSPVVAQEINSVIGHPAVSDAITSAAASGVKTAAAGGSSQDITTAMTADLAGSAANSAYSSAANDYNSTTGKVLGSATAGAVTGGAAGALNNALTTAASSIGTSKPPSDTSTKPVAAVDGGGGDSAILPSQADSLGGAAPDTTPPVVEPKQGAYLPEATPAPAPAPAPAEPVTAPVIAPSPDQAILELIKQPAVEPTPTPAPAPVSEPIQPTPVAKLYSGSMPDESAAETERLARLNQQATTPAAVEPTQGAYLPESTIDQQILDLIAEKPATTDVAAVGDEPATPDKTPVTAPPVEAPVTTVEPPVEVDPNIPRVEVPGVVNVEPTQGAYLPDTVPAETTPIEPAPVAEGYSTSMPDESAAETARLAAKEQQILDLITPAPVATEPKQGAYLPNAAPAPEAPDIPAADPMSQDPAQKAAALIDAPPVSDSDKQILDLISEAPTEDQSDAETERLARKEAELAGAEKGAYLPDSGTDTKTTTYKPDLFTTTYLSPKTRTAAAPASALGSALGTTGLTSYRGAGEIEGAGTGKARRKVWNEESLKLKDALGV